MDINDPQIQLSKPEILPLPQPGKTALDIEAHKDWFLRYQKSEEALLEADRDIMPMRLKLEHTMQVLKNAEVIIAEEKFTPPLARASLLAALYHDIARFEQYRLWNTFRDAISCSHGPLGARILRELGPLSNEPFLAGTVISAVDLHNAFALPDELSADQRLVTNLVRDADKIDIMRVINTHLSGPKPYSPSVVLSRPDDPTLWSQKVIDDVLAKRPANYADLTSVNDFRLLLGSWVFSLNFPASQRLIAAAGQMKAVVAALPEESPYKEARALVLEEIARLEG